MICTSCGNPIPTGGATCASCGDAAANPPLPTLRCAVLGSFGLVLLGGIFVALGISSKTHIGTRVPGCISNLREIRFYCDTYRSRFHSDAPTLRALYESGVITDPQSLVCPVKGLSATQVPGIPWESFAAEVGYEFRPPPKDRKDSVNPDYVIAWDRTPHRLGFRCVLFYAGRVEQLDDSAFQAALKTVP
ncbi:MAG: hypothetical protein K8T20_02005 [Planctomycetes bacterium]|nr:hypothetical protein [Planctomycetota bacterium]